MPAVVRRSQLVALILTAAIACTGGDERGDSDTAACTDAAPLDCADAPTPDPQTELCAARQEAACDGPIVAGGDDTCAWLTVRRDAGGSNMCE